MEKKEITEKMREHKKNNFLLLRVKPTFKELLKNRALMKYGNNHSLSKYIKKAMKYYDELIDAYTRFNNLFRDISELSDYLIRDKKGFTDLITKNIQDIDFIIKLNEELSI